MDAGLDGDRSATTVPPRAGTRWAIIAPRSRTSSRGEREWGRSALAASRDPKAPPRDPSAEPTPGVASPRLSPAPPSNPPSKEPPPGTRSPFLRAIRCSPQGWALPIVLMGEKGGFIVLWDGEEGGAHCSPWGERGAYCSPGALGKVSPAGRGGRGSPRGVRYCSPDGGGGPLSGVGERSCAAPQETAIRRGCAMGRGGGTRLPGGDGWGTRLP